MQNHKPDVVAALNRALPNVYPDVPGDDAELPAIAFRETDNSDAEAADDSYYTQREEYTVDVWGNWPEHDISGIAQAVDRELKKLDFRRASSFDAPRDESGAVHKTLIYEREI